MSAEIKIHIVTSSSIENGELRIVSSPFIINQLIF